MLCGARDSNEVVIARKESNVCVPAGVLIGHGAPRHNSEVEI